MTLRTLQGVKGTASIRRDLSAVEKIIKLETDELFWKRIKKIQSKWPNKITIEEFGIILQTYDIRPTPEIITAYVYARFDASERIDNDSLYESSSYRRGLLSGLLLEKVGRSYPDICITIDGKNKQFDNLFREARFTGNLSIKNVQGTGILSDAGKKGNITITTENILGEHNFGSIGSEGALFFLKKEPIQIYTPEFPAKKGILLFHDKNELQVHMKYNGRVVYSNHQYMERLEKETPYDDEQKKQIFKELLRVPVSRWNNILESYLGGQYDSP